MIAPKKIATLNFHYTSYRNSGKKRASVLTKWLHKINQNLCSRYNCSKEEYNKIIINNILENKPCHIFSVFKDNLIYECNQENLRRPYNKKEIWERIPKFYKLYKIYLLFFCTPTISDMVLNDLVKKYGEEKAEEYYRKNYPNAQTEESSQSDSSRGNKEYQSYLNETIFTDTLKQKIDNISVITNTTNQPENETITLRGDKSIIGELSTGSKENTLLSIINGFKKKPSKSDGKNPRVNKKDPAKKQIAQKTKTKIHQLVQKGLLSYNNLDKILKNQKNLNFKHLAESVSHHTINQKTNTPSTSKNKYKSLPKPPSGGSASNGTANHPKTRNVGRQIYSQPKQLGSIYKTVDLLLTNSNPKLNFTKTQNIENIIHKFSLSKKKLNSKGKETPYVKGNQHYNHSTSKKRIPTEVSSHTLIKNNPKPKKHIKPIIKIKKSASNIKLLTSSYSTLNQNKNIFSNGKNNLMKIALSLLMDNNSSTSKLKNYNHNTNINININNQININTNNNNSVNGKMSMNSLNEKLNRKLSRNEGVAMNIKSNLNKLTRNSTNLKGANGRTITSYHNKSISSLSYLVAKQKKISLSKSKSKSKNQKKKCK